MSKLDSPPPDKQPAAATLEEIAERFAHNHCLKAEEPQRFERLRSDVLSALRNERERCAKLIKQKRDGTTARYAYGGYSRELWHLNTETLKTVCNELLKEL